MTDIKGDTQILIDYSVDFATKMLTDNQEFFPFAVAINSNDELIPTSYIDGNEHPLSQDLINKLQLILDEQLDKRERKAYALTYDVKIKKENPGEKKDAIAIKIKHINTEDIIVYYFAYKMTRGKIVEHLESWGEIIT